MLVLKAGIGVLAGRESWNGTVKQEANGYPQIRRKPSWSSNF